MDNYAGTVILARVSTKGQEYEGYSLDSQYKLLHGYSTNLNLRLVKVFQIAESASKEQSRTVFHEMMHFVNLKRNGICNIVVEKADRYTRNFRDAVDLDDWLEADTNRRLHSVKEGIVLHKNANSNVKYTWNMNIANAKKYVDNLREEAMKGWAEKLAQGWLPGVPPPGYMTVTRTGKRIHIPNPDTKVAIKKVFSAYLEPSHSIITVTEFMKNLGVRTRNGRPYNKSKVQKMLHNPFYIGINRFNGKDTPGVQETFISKDVFNKVQYKLGRKRPSRYRQHDPVFKNIIRCNNCGGLVTWQLQKGRFYGTCQRKSDACKGRKLLREDRLEQIVADMLDKLVCPSQEIIQWVAETMRSQHQDEIQEKEALWNTTKAQIDRLTRMDDSLYEDKLAGDIPQTVYQEKHESFRKQKEDLERQLALIDRASASRLDQTLVLLELSQKAAQIYPKKTPSQKRLIITKLFKDITFDNNSLSVEFTTFTQAIASNVLETRKIIGGQE
ncbi:MAG: recombinase family protein [Candidatus Saccharimonadales bacterium]